MQTLFDQMVKDLIWANLCTCFTTTIVQFEYPAMHSYVAVAMIWGQLFGAIIFFGQLISTFVVRYFCIFHPSVIDSIEEKIIIRISRWVNYWITYTVSNTALYDFRGLIVTTATFSTIYEILSVDFGYGPIYDFLMNFEHKENKPKSLVTVKYISVVALITITYIQLKIKYEEWRDRNKIFLNQEYRWATVKVVLCVTMLSLTLVLLWLIISPQIDDPHLLRLGLYMIYMSLNSITIPVILISKNDKMRTFCRNAIKSALGTIHPFKCHQRVSPQKSTSLSTVSNQECFDMTVNEMILQTYWNTK